MSAAGCDCVQFVRNELLQTCATEAPTNPDDEFEVVVYNHTPTMRSQKYLWTCAKCGRLPDHDLRYRLDHAADEYFARKGLPT
jgi:hypothetical protein